MANAEQQKILQNTDQTLREFSREIKNLASDLDKETLRIPEQLKHINASIEKLGELIEQAKAIGREALQSVSEHTASNASELSSE